MTELRNLTGLQVSVRRRNVQKNWKFDDSRIAGGLNGKLRT